jgi:3-(methylthio)propanoyl-CoA dehydrogenase
MIYTPPIAEQRFVLETITGIAELGVDSDLVDAILDGAGALAAGEFAPLNRIGDTVGARWADGKVTMPEGFRAAYKAYVDGGWVRSMVPKRSAGRGCRSASPPSFSKISAPRTWRSTCVRC